MAIAVHSNLNPLLLKHEKKHHGPQRSSYLPIIKAVQGSQLIESGIIRAVTPNEAATALKSGDGGFKLLDVRPEWEWQRARVPGSIHIPLFIEDVDNSPLTLLKKWVHFGYIGLWTGQRFTTINNDFVEQVQGLVPEKDSMLLVACGEGLRSTMAVSKLHEAGYRNLGWLVGGFNRAKDKDFPVEGDDKLQYATIGGVSYILTTSFGCLFFCKEKTLTVKFSFLIRGRV